MKTRCPFCKKVFKAPEVYKGKMVHCPDCKEHFLVSEYHEPIIDPVTIEKAKSVAKEKAKDNVFTMAWKRSPASFRIGFLSTIGAIAALFVSWHFFNFSGNILNRPPKAASQVQQPETFARSSNLSPGVSDPYYLAAAIRINQYMSKLQAVQEARITAAETYSDKGDLLSTAIVLNCTCSQLKNLYEIVSDMEIPNNKEIITAHNALQMAIKSEYDFQRSLIEITRSQRSSDLNKVGQKAKEAVSLFDTAIIQAVYVLSEADPSLLEAIVTVDGNK